MQNARTRTLVFTGLFALLLACALPALAYAAEGSASLAVGTMASGSSVAVDTTGSDQSAAADAAGEAVAEPVPPGITYRAHVQGEKWQPWTLNGKKAGTGDVSSAVDSLAIGVTGDTPGSVQYQVYIKGTGWQAVKADKKKAGKVSVTDNIEAVRVVLTGELSTQYSVKYRVKTQASEDWQKWKYNGKVAGAAASDTPITAFEVKLVKRKAVADEGEGIVGVRYRTKVKGSSSWLPWVHNYAKSGSSSTGTPIRSLCISLDKGTYSGSVEYQFRSTNGTVREIKSDGGATISSGNLEAINIKMVGTINSKYRIMYRVYVEGLGWLKRTYDGAWAGTEGKGKRIKAIKIKLVERDKIDGWYGYDSTWKYYKDGVVLKGQWIKTKESPINSSMTKAQYYWLDSKGNLAVNRLINPKKSKDKKAGYKAYATSNGYVMRSKTAWVGNGWYTANSKGQLYVSKNKRIKSIGKFVKWAVKIAKDDSHGYSQAVRWGKDYDCSSLVISAVRAAGLSAGGAYWTGNMKSELTSHGFKWHTDFSKLEAGDILLVHNSNRQHTELYIGNGLTVGAHIAETGGIYGELGDQTGHEIDVGPYYAIWDGYLRYKK